jgi:hypothetical protein
VIKIAQKTNWVDIKAFSKGMHECTECPEDKVAEWLRPDGGMSCDKCKAKEINGQEK